MLNHILDTIHKAEIGSLFNEYHFWIIKICTIFLETNVDYAIKQDSDDAVNVNLWITEMNDYRINVPVLYHKNQSDEDSNLNDSKFALVLMINFQTQQILKYGPN